MTYNDEYAAALRYASNSRTTPHQPDRPNQPPAAHGLEPLKAHGQSGTYFKQGGYFYKKPDLDHALAVEPAAAKFFKLLGVHNVVEPEHVTVGGEGYLRSPHLGDAVVPLGNFKEGTSPVHAHPTRDQLARYAIASYLSHSNDRHFGNTVFANGAFHHIDFGDAFHPEAGVARKPVHPNIGNAMLEEFNAGPLRLPHLLIREALAKKADLRKLVEEGTRTMDPFRRQEALDLFDRKMDVLHGLKSVLEPTTYHLPPFTEHGMEGEPYAE